MICKNCIRLCKTTGQDVYRRYNELPDLHILKNLIIAPYREDIKKLQAEVQLLQTMVEFQPGGAGAMAAKESFSSFSSFDS